ncbi:hypothetical protein Aperf_G00000098058 [Anoplocephala perfoliata]
MCRNFSGTTPTIFQRRQIAFAAIFVFFSLALIIAEAKRPGSSFVGYWAGAVGFLPSIFAIVYFIKAEDYVLIASCVSDIIASAVCIGGAILSLLSFSANAYAVGWFSVILATFLLYHAFAIFGKLNICCRMALSDITDDESEERGHSRRNRDSPLAPPVGFLMPDEIPKLPNYDQLSVRGDPPPYREVCSQRSPVASTPAPAPPPPRPPIALNTRVRQRSSSATRVVTNSGASNRASSLETLERT